MDLNKIIKSRHSIRKFQKKDVDYKLIGTILEVCRFAPSSGNIQNWRFIIVKDKEKKEKIANLSLNQMWMIEAPVHLVICYDNRNIKMLYPENYKEFSIQNVSIISTMIMLKINELELGACWISVTKQKQISTLLNLPEYIIPSVIITLGYPEGINKKSSRNNIELMTYLEEFGRKQVNRKLIPEYLKKLKLKK